MHRLPNNRRPHHNIRASPNRTSTYRLIPTEPESSTPDPARTGPTEMLALIEFD